MSKNIQPFSVSINSQIANTETVDRFGGPGSGFFGHKGRPGTRGGAAALDDDTDKDRKPFFSRERKAMGLTGASSARIRVAVERSYTNQTLTALDKEILQVLWPSIHGHPEITFVGLQEAIKEERKSGDTKTSEKMGSPKPPDSCSETNWKVGFAVLKLFQYQSNYHCTVGYY